MDSDRQLVDRVLVGDRVAAHGSRGQEVFMGKKVTSSGTGTIQSGKVGGVVPPKSYDSKWDAIKAEVGGIVSDGRMGCCG
jgi:hypothetical protein